MGDQRIDLGLLEEFERSLDPRHPERGERPARVLGFGEISTVLEIEGLEGWACKRMPMFRSREEVEAFEGVYRDYVSILSDQIGLRAVPGQLLTVTTSPEARVVVYIVQPKLASASIANKAIHQIAPDDTRKLVLAVLSQTGKVFAFNSLHRGELEVGFDAQISNWAIEGFVPQRPGYPEGSELMYFDTSTPFVRRQGHEKLNSELFLRSAPPFLVWILRLLFLKDVMTRYYDFRKVAMDIAANFYKEQRADLVPELVDVINGFFGGREKPLSLAEVRSYYREDAWIWRLYLAFRKVDRAMRRVVGGEYPYILPQKVIR
jgi:hypothetical protein